MVAKKKNVPADKNMLKLLRDDEYLRPFAYAVNGRHARVMDKIAQLTGNGKVSLADFASGHLYFGLHKTTDGWVFREWAPNATAIYLVGDFNHWKENSKYKAKRIPGTENWELTLPEQSLKHGDLSLRLLAVGKGAHGNAMLYSHTRNRVNGDIGTAVFASVIVGTLH